MVEGALIFLPCFYYGSTGLVRQGILIDEVSRSHSGTPSRAPLDEGSASRNTQQSHKPDLHTPGGTRTRKTNKRATDDPRLRPPGHRNRLRTRTQKLIWDRVRVVRVVVIKFSKLLVEEQSVIWNNPVKRKHSRILKCDIKQLYLREGPVYVCTEQIPPNTTAELLIC